MDTALRLQIGNLLKTSDANAVLDVLMSGINDDYSTENTDITVLMNAAKYGRFKCCEFLLNEKQSKIDLQNSKGYSALHYACYGGHTDVAFFLLKSGADPSLR